MRSLTDEYGPMMGNHGIGGSLFQTDDSLGLLVDQRALLSSAGG